MPENEHVHAGHHAPADDEGHPISWGLAVDFANTVACKACHSSDSIATSESFVRWNRAHPQLPEIGTSPAVRGRLVGFRRDIRMLLERQDAGGSPDPVSLARMNHILRGTRTHLLAGFDQGHWRFEEVPEHLTPTQGWMWTVTRAIADLLGGEQVGKLLKCQAPTCDHFVVRRMRDQLWCSPACGNRIRVARHYARVRRMTHGPRPTKRAR